MKGSRKGALEIMGFKKGTEAFKHCKVQKKLLSGIILLCHSEVIVASNRGAAKESHFSRETKNTVDRSKGR